MKLFERTRGAAPAPRSAHWLSLTVSVLTAILMWYVISVRDLLEAQLEVSIDYYGIPQNLIVTEGLVSKAVVRLRGPEALLRSVSAQHRTHAIDLSGIRQGVTVVHLGDDSISKGAFRAFEVMDIQPPRIVIKADALLERSVPLRVRVDSPLRDGALTVENISVSPDTVVLRGPEKILSEISSLPLVIMLDPKAAGASVTQNITLEPPGLVTATPPSVRAQYTITSGRTVLSRRCKIVLAAEKPRQYTVEPEEITLFLEVPDALAKNASYLSQMEVSVAPPELEPGESRRASLHFSLPEGMSLLNPSVEEVRVTRRDK